jgi:multiple sugar transport system ATP-binding protein
MDEPLSNLDAKLRVQMRAEIHRLQRRLGVTTLYVTHDQVEAMTMGDRVAVMRDGHLQQVDTPQVLYDSPVNEFVAGFIGSPSINLVEAELGRNDGRLTVTFGEHRLPVDDQLARNRSALERYVGRTIVLGIRPESFEDASLVSDVPAGGRFKTTVDLIEPLGSEVLVYFTASATQFISSAAAENVADAEVRLGEEEDEGARAHLVARLDPHTRVAMGNEVELTVDTSKLYFFDPETRAAI